MRAGRADVTRCYALQGNTILVMDYMEMGTLWENLPRRNRKDEYVFQWQNRCGCTLSLPAATQRLRDQVSVLLVSRPDGCGRLPPRLQTPMRPHHMERPHCCMLTARTAVRACRGKKVAYEVAVGLHCLHEIRLALSSDCTACPLIVPACALAAWHAESACRCITRGAVQGPFRLLRLHWTCYMQARAPGPEVLQRPARGRRHSQDLRCGHGRHDEQRVPDQAAAGLHARLGRARGRHRRCAGTPRVANARRCCPGNRSRMLLSSSPAEAAIPLHIACTSCCMLRQAHLSWCNCWQGA